MGNFSLVGQNVNGDPFTTGNNINIVNNSVSLLTFVDNDGLLNAPGSGDVVILNGTSYNYQYMGTGDVRGDPNQHAAFVRIDLGSGNFLTVAIHLNPSPSQPDLQNGNTGLQIGDLDPGEAPPFPVPCFTPGTLIRTPRGEVAVEDIRPGDLVETLDGPKPVRWTGRRTVSPAMLAFRPRLRPVRIAAGALGDGLPRRDLTVSPQHRVLISDWRAELLFGVSQVLVPARHLVNDRDIVIDHDCRSVDYIHLLFDSHETVFSEGLPTESFYPGPDVISAMEPEARAELFELFPELDQDGAAFGPSRFPSLKGFEARLLLG